MSADRNLLFAILALKMELLNAGQFAEACSAWADDPDMPLGAWLVERGWLTAADQEKVEQALANASEVAAAGAATLAAPTAQESFVTLDCPGKRAEPRSPNDTSPDARPSRAPTLDGPPQPHRRYTLTRLHAKGGIGQVWLANDVELGRVVALKELRPEWSENSTIWARFLEEARITGQLEHPGIVPVYELIRPGKGRPPFYTMRFVRGQALTDAIKSYHRKRAAGTSTALELRELLGAFVSVCNAVAYAHARSVLHRDLKPQNVALGAFGEVMVLDWGLAKLFDGQEANPVLPPVSLDEDVPHAGTVLGQVLGTPSYMAPEQAEGRQDNVGTHTDVYGLGAILYEILTGEAPFTGPNSLEILRKVVHESPMPPHRAVPSTPRALEAVCLKALARKPEHRYPSAAALRQDVERWLADEPVVSYPDPFKTRVRRWVSRHKTLVAAVVAALMVATLGLGAGLFFLARAREREHNLRETAEEQRNAADELRHEAELSVSNLYFLHMYLAKRAWDDGDVPRTLELLRAHEHPKPDTPDLRSFEWQYLWHLCHADRMTLSGHGDPVLAVAYDPTGDRLASASEDQIIKIWDMKSGSELAALRGHTGPVRSVCFRPDGKRLASAGDDGTVRTWDPETGRPVQMFQAHADKVWAVVFSPDGRLLATASGDTLIRLWNAETGQPERILGGHLAAVLSLSFSPDGKQLASGSDDHTIKLWDPANGKLLATLEGHAGPVHSVCYGPDSRRLASGSEDATVRLWDTQTWKELAPLRDHTAAVFTVCFSPDGQHLASASADRSIIVWDLATRQRLLLLKGHTGAVRGVCFSPDRTSLASASGDKTIKIWNVYQRQDALVLRVPERGVDSIAFSLDGKWLASSGEDRRVRLWSARTGEVVHVLEGHTSPVWGVSFHPDGKRLASASLDKTVRIWDVESGKLLDTLRGHAREVTAVCYSPDGKRLASACDDHTAILWDAATGEVLHTLRGHTGPVYGLAFSPDSRYLASSSRDKTVRIWDVASGTEVRQLTGHTQQVSALCFSPDGNHLATASDDTTVKVWDLQTGSEQHCLKGHTNAVWGICYSPDGKRLASASLDRTVKVWDAGTGQEALSLAGHTERVNAVCFSPDGKQLASASDDGTVMLRNTEGAGRGP